jgi:hypothetical protein
MGGQTEQGLLDVTIRKTVRLKAGDPSHDFDTWDRICNLLRVAADVRELGGMAGGVRRSIDGGCQIDDLPRTSRKEAPRMDDQLVALIAIISTISAVVFYSEQRRLAKELGERTNQHVTDLWGAAEKLDECRERLAQCEGERDQRDQRHPTFLTVPEIAGHLRNKDGIPRDRDGIPEMNRHLAEFHGSSRPSALQERHHKMLHLGDEPTSSL